MKRTLIALALTLVTGPTLAAADPDRLLAARVLQCNFDDGNAADWKSGKAKLKAASFKSVGMVTFDSINPKKRTARFVGNNNAVGVFAFHTDRGVHFIEETPGGSVMVTTVFTHLDSGGGFIAVTSRHLDLFGPVPSQYHGTCHVRA